MRTHNRVSKALLGLAAAAAAIGLLGFPVAATTVTSGVINFYDSNNSFFDDIDFGSAPRCAAGSGSITKTGTTTSGTWSATINEDLATSFGGANRRAVVTGSFSGTYSGSNLTGTGSFTVVFRRTTGVDSCIVLTGAGPCTVAATAINVTGTHTAGSVTISGDNASGGDLGFELAVAGIAPDCGAIIVLDDGYAALVNIVIS
jgi:hypothetical protein